MDCMKLNPQYVAGFMFDPSLHTMVLLRKTKGRKHLIGRINGVGGKIEIGESARGAMAREFEEETQCKTKPEDWTCFHTIHHADTGVDIHMMAMIGQAEHFDQVMCGINSDGEEVIVVSDLTRRYRDEMYNLTYLIAMARCYLEHKTL